MLNYKAIEIFTSEEARYRKKPVADAVMQYIKDLKIAARCIVTRGVAGSYESGEVATGRIVILSFNMPRIRRPCRPSPTRVRNRTGNPRRLR